MGTDNSTLELSRSENELCFNFDLSKWNIFHIHSADNLEQMVQWLEVRERISSQFFSQTSKKTKTYFQNIS